MPGDTSLQLRTGLGREASPQVFSRLLTEGDTRVGGKESV